MIAAIHGVCLGGGLQVASGADIRVAAPDARLSIMEMKWGIVPDMGGYALWRGMVREDVLRELVFTAREFSGEEALALGLATILDPDPVARATAIAGEIAAKNPHGGGNPARGKPRPARADLFEEPARGGDEPA
ncbi:MAG: enoyl-CoA hydratase [Proteobacteria bacterium]|nr:enoyl-CoA hydratase [Pseudomonadota bacterium]